MNVLFLVPYPTEGASNRVRIEQYLPHLDAQGIEWTLRPFVASAFYRILYQRHRAGAKLAHFGLSCLGRLRDMLRLRNYDLVVVHREAFPIGPPWVEGAVRWLDIPMVFDFDDSIFLSTTSEPNTYVERFKRPGKVATIIGWSQEVIAGNTFLAHFAMQFNPRVTVIPSVIDTEAYRPLDRPPERDEVVIGWIGSHSTRTFVAVLKPVFQALAERYRHVRFEFVGTEHPITEVEHLTARAWQLERELTDVQGFDIGVMPMPDDLWSQGKCGFKAILYQACGLPVVCSPVGVNREIVLDGVSGFLADSKEEWAEKLSSLIEDADLRRSLGEKGRQRVESQYSVAVHRERFV
ncbi:MAG: glycosyltransferase family 4 protein, partial [Nitrospinota bacterium]